MRRRGQMSGFERAHVDHIASCWNSVAGQLIHQRDPSAHCCCSLSLSLFNGTVSLCPPSLISFSLCLSLSLCPTLSLSLSLSVSLSLSLCPPPLSLYLFLSLSLSLCPPSLFISVDVSFPLPPFLNERKSLNLN